MRLKLRFVFKLIWTIVPWIVLSSIAKPVLAAEAAFPSVGAFRVLTDKATKIEDVNRTEGWSFIVSGGVALLVSTPAFYMTEDTFARAIYSLGQTLGVGSIGYGSYLVLMKNDYYVFQQIVAQTKNLSPASRDELAYRFLHANAVKAKAVRKIRTITHGLTAALNISNGITSNESELSTALYFIGGINILAALNFAFRQSEEEKFLDQMSPRESAQAKIEVSPIIGPLVGLQIRF